MCKWHLKFSVALATLLLLAMMIGSLPASVPAVAQGGQSIPFVTPPVDGAPSTLVGSPPATPSTGSAVASLHEMAPGGRDLPGAQSEIDARVLLARWRAAGSPINQPVFDDAAIARIAALSPAALAAADSFAGGKPNRDPASTGSGGAPLAAPDVPAVSPTLNITPPATSATNTAADPHITPYGRGGVLAQTSPPQNCTQILADTGNANPTITPSYWPVYEQIVYYATDQYTSAPYSWYLAENELGVYDGPVEDTDTVRDTRPGRNTDVDSFGQPFDVPADAVTLNGALNFQYVYGTTVPDDRLYVEIYNAGLSGGTTSYGAYIDGTFVDVGSLDDGQWKTFNWSITNESTLALMRGQRVVLRLSTWNNNNGISTKLYIDDVTVNICQPAVVGGYVTQLGNGAVSSPDMSNAVLLLTDGSQPLAITTPRSDGLYRFGGLPVLPANLHYQVVYINYSADDRPLDDSRLSLMYGPSTSGTIGASDVVVLPTFDISNIILLQPGSSATVEAPAGQSVNFTWQSRGLPAGYPAEYFQQCIYDPQTVYPGTSKPVILCVPPLGDNPGEIPTQVNVKAGSQISGGSFPNDYPFAYGRRYAWYVTACTATVDTNGDGIGDWCAGQVSYSFYQDTVTFVEHVTPPPNDPKQPGGSLPTKGGKRAWTVMVYFGGDNELSDSESIQPISNLQHHFETIKNLAPQIATAHVVTLTDFYGNTGTQICYLSDPSGPQCQELGEQNSADPNLLTRFVTQGLAYPSDYTMLVIADHGHAVMGVSVDDTSRVDQKQDSPAMAPNQIVGALAAAGMSRKLDVLFFNTCLMATVEVAVMMAPYANYMVASADEIWVLPFYDGIFALLNGGPRDVASGIPDAYSAALDAVDPGVYRTLIALDLSKLDVVNTALNDLAEKLKAVVNSQPSWQTIMSQRDLTQVYDSSGNNLLDQIWDNTGQQTSVVQEDAFVDVKHLTTLLSDSTNPPAIVQAAGSLAGTLSDGLVVKSLARSGSNDENARHDYVSGAIGLGLYFPNNDDEAKQPPLRKLYLYDDNLRPFKVNSTWDDFVRSYTDSVFASGKSTMGRGGRPTAGRPLHVSTTVTPPTLRVYLPLLIR